MIFYFTGTGNSRWVANELGKRLNQSVTSISLLMHQADQVQERGPVVYEPAENEPVIFVFPVHSWGPAVLMRRFVERLDLRLPRQTGPICFVATCGDDAAYTDRIFRRLLARKGLSLTAGYAVRMPNNYLLLPGFGVDAPEVEAQKLGEAPAYVDRIADRILAGGIADPELYARTGWSWIKSRVVYPLFRRYKIGKTSFWTKDNCTGCGRCVHICPVGNIRMQGNRPVWSDHCVECVACIHRCPMQAIEYGKASVGQGRYVHPDFMR